MKLLLTLLGCVTMLALAAPGHSDPGVDDPPADNPAFLASLQNAGISYQDPDQAIAAAKAMCGMADSGKSGLEVLRNLQTANPGFTTDGAAQFAAIAANTFCPHQLSSGSSSK